MEIGNEVEVIRSGCFMAKVGSKGTISEISSEYVTIDFHKQYLHDQIVGLDVFDRYCKLIPQQNNVDHPNHYNQGKIEVIDYIEDKGFNFNLGNAIKYISRCEHKGKKKEDLEKAIWYIKREIKKDEV